ncbi:MAG: SMI1/KNR4 family protein [Beijerinckiaceae bacterium]
MTIRKVGAGVMKHPAEISVIEKAEKVLGMRLPMELRERYLRDNSGALVIESGEWTLIPLPDSSTSEANARTERNMFSIALEVKSWSVGFPETGYPFAEDGAGNFALIMLDRSGYWDWDNDTRDTSPISKILWT